MLALMLPHNGRVLSQPHIAVRDGGDLDGRQRQAVLRKIQGRCTQHKTIETAAGSEIDDPLAGLEGTHRERVSNTGKSFNRASGGNEGCRESLRAIECATAPSAKVSTHDEGYVTETAVLPQERTAEPCRDSPRPLPMPIWGA